MRKYCLDCGILVADIRDASIRKGTQFLCIECAALDEPPEQRLDMPDFLKEIFGGEH